MREQRVRQRRGRVRAGRRARRRRDIARLVQAHLRVPGDNQLFYQLLTIHY